MLLDFGKYKGQFIQDVPLEYVIFLAGWYMDGPRRRLSDSKASNWLRKNKKDAHMFARGYLSGKCWSCGSKLVPVGEARMNGACHSDWEVRYLHKTCWRQLNEEDL